MENENIINFKVTREEAEELCYAIDEQEGALLDKCKTSTDPWQRKYLRERCELAHHLRVRLEQVLNEHPVPPIEVPSFGLNDMLAMVFPMMAGPRSDNTHSNNEVNQEEDYENEEHA